jgi:hypothetical protein
VDEIRERCEYDEDPAVCAVWDIAAARSQVRCRFRFLEPPRPTSGFPPPTEVMAGDPMATARAKRVRALGTRVRQPRRSSANASRKSKSYRLDAIHLRVADVEAALDLVKASVRFAAPAFAAAVIGPERAGVNRFFGAFRLVPPTKT